MTISIIAIKGNYTLNASEIFATFGYNEINADKTFLNREEYYHYLSDKTNNPEHEDDSFRGISFQNDWTIIIDPELIDTHNTPSLMSISSDLNADVFACCIQTTSGTFSFTYIKQEEIRTFFCLDGEIVDDQGNKLMQEIGLNINSNINEDDIIKLAHHLGIDIENGQSDKYIVKHLMAEDEEDEEE